MLTSLHPSVSILDKAPWNMLHHVCMRVLIDIGCPWVHVWMLCDIMTRSRELQRTG